MSPLQQSTSNWLHGLIGAAISGGASAVVSGITTSAIAPDAFNLSTKLGHTLELMFALFVVNGIIGAMLYLKQSPVPTSTVQITETKSETVTVQPVTDEHTIVPKTEHGQVHD